MAINATTMIIDPWPAAARNSRIDMDGQRMADPIRRYREHRTRVPQLQSTRKIATTSSPSATEAAK